MRINIEQKYENKYWSQILELILEHLKVTKMLGNGRLEAMCFDGVKRLCHIRGKLRKKVIFNLKLSPIHMNEVMKPIKTANNRYELMKYAFQVLF